MNKVVGTGLPRGNGKEIFHSIVGSSKKILPINKEGLVFYMPVDSNYSNIVFDVSEKLNHGTRYGAIVTDNGKVGKGLQFDGIDDYVDCGNGGSLQFTPSDSFSLIAWIKTTDTNGFRIINKKGGINDRGWDIVYTLNHLRFHIIDSMLGSRRIRDATGLNLNDNNWHLVVATYDGSGNISGMKMYMDGIEVLHYSTYSNIGTLSNIESGNPLCLGSQYSANYFFAGKMDEIKIYNRALSPEEILADYQREV